MMDYEIFLEVVKEKFLDYMPEQFQGATVVMNSINKVNCKKDGLTIHTQGEERISPNLYVNEMYEHYKRCGDLDEVLRTGASIYLDALEQVPAKKFKLDVADFKDNVVMLLINSEQNKDLLLDVPNKPFQDLSVVFKWVISIDEKGMAGTIVTNDLMKTMGINMEDLMKYAVENTKRICPPKIESMEEMLFGSLGDDMDQDLATMLNMFGENPKEKMWVVTNNIGIDGAAAMLYEENLHILAEKMGTDLYLLPSSVHEWIAVSVEMGTPEELSEMVQEVNMGVVSLDERLSNNVYHYDKDLRKVTLATDVPNKRLDGVIAEPPMIYNTDNPKR